jgi:hypothetical protein
VTIAKGGAKKNAGGALHRNGAGWRQALPLRAQHVLFRGGQLKKAVAKHNFHNKYERTEIVYEYHGFWEKKK